MPALAPVPGVIRCTLKFNMSTDLDVLTRFFLKYTGTAPDNTAMTTFAQNVGNFFIQAYQANMHTSTTFVEAEAVDLTTPTSGVGVFLTSAAGTHSGDSLAAGSCTLLNFKVQRRYRGGKPRAYLPIGVSQNLLNAQQWNAAYATAQATAWTSYINGLIAAPPGTTTLSGQVSVSYYEGFTTFTGSTGRVKNISTPRTTPLVDVIIGHSTNPNVASQRRRNRP